MKGPRVMIHKAFVETDRGPVARVTFTLLDSIWADKIYLVGDFNDWNRTSHPFQNDGTGKWAITVDLELGRAYQFRYLIGEHWTNDDQADAHVYNRYGTSNFVVVTDPNFRPYRDEKA